MKVKLNTSYIKIRTSRLSCDRLQIVEETDEGYRVQAWNFLHQRWDTGTRMMNKAVFRTNYALEQK